MRICAVLALILALIGPALAGPSADDLPSANDVMPSCRSLLRKVQTQPHFDADKSYKKEDVACITGLDVVTLMFSLAPADDPPFCIPDDVTLGQRVAVVVKYIDQHPEEMHQSFAYLAYRASEEAWPCKP
jgi:hypothetical protein